MISRRGGNRHECGAPDPGLSSASDWCMRAGMGVDTLTPGLIAIACLVAWIAGFVKGAVGFAMPLILLSGLSLVMDPRLAIAGLLIPTFASNLLQIARAGRAEARAAAWDLRLFVLGVCVMVFLVTQVVPEIPTRAIYLAVGGPVLALSLLQLAGPRFSVAPERRRALDLGVGALAGTVGGIGGIWGPPTVLYLMALGVDRARQMAAQGVVYFLGSVMLILGHATSGLLNRYTVPFSLLLLLPAGLGMWAGFRLGDRMDPARFRTATLAVLVIAALNLIRRGIWG